MPSPQASTALRVVRLPGQLRSALRLFREMTSLTAVTSLATPVDGSAQGSVLSPPVHPRCARQLRSVRTPPPCREQWSLHLRSSRRSPRAHAHKCPVGLRCACVPIRFDRDLVGVVKLVAGPETPGRVFSGATRLLQMVVSGVCQESLVTMLSEEVVELRLSVAELRQTQPSVPGADALDSPVGTVDPRAVQRQNLTLVDSALSHLHRHYREPGLSLPAVAEALGCNPRYLTTRFTRVIGERMHAYLVRLRVGHACRLLVDTGVPIKEVAYGSGFRGNSALARAFRRQVGVSPREYRALFAGDA
jgi:AraC-like DNA-binding protein